MKTIIIISSVIILSLLSVIFLGSTELFKENELRQKEIDHLKIRNLMDKKAFEHALDSIRKDFKQSMDSVTFAHGESLKANVLSQREIKILKGIAFVQHNDSSRTAELKNLYPTFNP